MLSSLIWRDESHGEWERSAADQTSGDGFLRQMTLWPMCALSCHHHISAVFNVNSVWRIELLKQTTKLFEWWVTMLFVFLESSQDMINYLFILLSWSKSFQTLLYIKIWCNDKNFWFENINNFTWKPIFNNFLCQLYLPLVMNAN